MIKIYFLALIGLSVAVWLGLDAYMTAKKLAWASILTVWPFWALTMAVGALIGGFVWGVLASIAVTHESNALKAQSEEEVASYQKSLRTKEVALTNREASLKKTMTLQDNELEKKAAKAKEKTKQKRYEAEYMMLKAKGLEKEYQRLSSEIREENQSLKLQALNAKKMLRRIQKKHQKALGRLKEQA